jgi:hypothetical protein
MLRAALPTAALLEVTIRGLPDIKSPPSPLINPFNPQESFSLQFFGRFTAACVAGGGGREPDKGGLCGAQYQHGAPRLVKIVSKQ